MEPATHPNTLRSLRQIVQALPSDPGNGDTVYQPIPTRGLRQVDPFILLHHFGPRKVAPGQTGLDIGAHPHRGFEPVTFLFEGELAHRDSLGNHGHLKGGDVQWMTAGAGVIHSEGTPPHFNRKGGTLHGIQLWVNLPRARKMANPRYQDIPSAAIPVAEPRPGARLRLVAGEAFGLRGPAQTFTPLMALHGMLEEGAEATIPIPENYQALVYVTQGSVSTAGKTIREREMGVWAEDGEAVAFRAPEPAEFLLLAGEPVREPMASYGPFVMNSVEELEQAFADYHAGKMGWLED